MLLRYLYILRSSWPRTLGAAVLADPADADLGVHEPVPLCATARYVARAFGVLLAAVMLWDLLFRSQLGLSISFLEEMWSRNLGHLFVDPAAPL